MDLGLAGKKAVVTGGSHGIGRSIVLALAAEGVDVAFCSRSQERLDATLTLLEEWPVNKIALQADALSRSDINDFANSVLGCWGGADILINNVGGGGRWGHEDVFETPRHTWDEVYQKNTGAAIDLILKFLPSMVENCWGRVISITSIYGVMGGGRPWFNIAKTAQTALMKNFSLNRQFVRKGITFNSIAPGGIDIPDTGWSAKRSSDPEGFDAMVEAQFPIGRMGKPEEVADLALFLSSTRSSLINGSSIVIDGAETPIF